MSKHTRKAPQPPSASPQKLIKALRRLHRPLREGEKQILTALARQYVDALLADVQRENSPKNDAAMPASSDSGGAQ